VQCGKKASEKLNKISLCSTARGKKLLSVKVGKCQQLHLCGRWTNDDTLALPEKDGKHNSIL